MNEKGSEGERTTVYRLARLFVVEELPCSYTRIQKNTYFLIYCSFP